MRRRRGQAPKASGTAASPNAVEPRLVTPWIVGAFLLGSLVMLAGVAHNYYQRVQAHTEALGVRAEGTVRIQEQLARERLQTSMSDVLLAASHTELQDWLHAPEEDRPRALARLQDEFLQMVRYRHCYHQIRLLDESGHEVLRINQSGGPAETATGQLVASEDLQDKSQRYYFQRVRKLPPGSVYVSPFDLNMEHGVVEQPLRPSIRFATPVHDRAQRFRGVVVLNYAGGQLLDTLKQTEPDQELEVHVIDDRGFWMLSPDARDAWGSMLPERANRRFARSQAEAWRTIQHSPEGQLTADAGIFTYRTICPASGLATVVDPLAGSAPNCWKLVHRIPSPYLARDASLAFTDSLASFMLFEALLLVGVIALARLARQRTRAHAEMRRHAETDGLTGVWNRRKLLALGQQELQRADRYGTPLALCMVDLDHFKLINDACGHRAGDEVLVQASARMLECTRQADVVGRYGGEEFLVLLPHTDERGAQAFTERFHAAMSECEQPCLRERNMRATASIGVAMRLPGESLEALTRRADEALYAAKRSGRNRTVLASQLDRMRQTSGVMAIPNAAPEISH